MIKSELMYPGLAVHIMNNLEDTCELTMLVTSKDIKKSIHYAFFVNGTVVHSCIVSTIYEKMIDCEQVEILYRLIKKFTKSGKV